MEIMQINLLQSGGAALIELSYDIADTNLCTRTHWNIQFVSQSNCKKKIERIPLKYFFVAHGEHVMIWYFFRFFFVYVEHEIYVVIHKLKRDSCLRLF